MNIYTHILKSKKEGKKSFALLIDPDKQDKNQTYQQLLKKQKMPKQTTFLLVEAYLQMIV